MISFFFKRKKQSETGAVAPLKADMHSHLLPGLDDGAEHLEQSLALVREFIALGYEKLVMTPHVMGDFYQNSPEAIREKLQLLRDAVHAQGLEIGLEAAAEYYLDESFVARLEAKEELLCFGKEKYVLFETSFMNSSPHFDTVVFKLQAAGYRPVLAHPERYVYLFDNYQKLHELHERGVLLQINLNSLVGYYSKPSKTIAEKLIGDKLVSFIGSDCHGERHIAAMKHARAQEHYKKAMALEPLNHSL